MLNLINLLKANGLSLDNFKIHLATGANPTPLNAFFAGHFKEWQECQNNKNFPCKQIVSLISMDADKWLFAGVYDVLGVAEGGKCTYAYRTRLVPGQDDLIGRIVIRYKRQYRASYIWGHKYGQLLEIAEIKPIRLSIREFPGYNNAIASHQELRLIVEQLEPTWKAALENVKGVYLITDRKTGKTYVGSATGEGGIWQRWEAYARTGHGGNTELKEVIRTVGSAHLDNFQYAILEIADSHASDEHISKREVHWKNVLLSREFGYNSN